MNAEKSTPGAETTAMNFVNGVLSVFRRHQILTLVALLVILCIGIELRLPGTVTPTWISNALLFAAPLGVFSAGQTLVMLTGGIDLSVVAVATGSAYLLATNASHGTIASVAIGMSLGLVVGLLNGIGIAVLQVQPLVMTLGTGLMTLGFTTVYSQKMLASNPQIPEFLTAIGTGKVFDLIPIDLFVWIPLSAVMILALRYTGFGRLLYAIGDNREACKLSGIRVWRVLLIDYLLCSLLAAAAGLILVGNSNAADLGLADQYLLPSVAAVIIGGTSIFGGRGGYSGSIVGAIILTVLTSLLTLLDVPEPVRQILYGGIILTLAAAYTRLTD